MFRVITQNSVYLVTPVGNGFVVRRVADMWGRKVKDSHEHFSSSVVIAVGGYLTTDQMRSSRIQAVTSGVQPKSK